MANVDINVYIIARENLFYPRKIDRASYGARLISNTAGLTPYDIGHRPMLSFTDSGRRPYHMYRETA